jgi:hypothetical protein
MKKKFLVPVIIILSFIISQSQAQFPNPLGIGSTTNPTATMLDVASDGTKDIIQWRGTSSGSTLGTIKSNGFLGIATNNPTDALQIGDRWVFQNGGWKGILNNMTWDFNAGKNVRLVAAPISGIFFTDQGNTAFLNGPSNAAGTTSDDATFGMIVYNTGQVGIGTPYDISFLDKSYKLNVNGNLRARSVRVDQATWYDHVFNANYRLRSLNEVEQYIQQYHHLPEVPSASEVRKDGLDVGDNQATLLKKIEELTLYAIEQNKKIQQLEQRLSDIEKKKGK